VPARADDALLATLRAVAGAFRELGAPAMIIGGVAVIARGVPRQTVDVDGTVWAEGLDVERGSRSAWPGCLRAGGAGPRHGGGRRRHRCAGRHGREDLVVYKTVAWRDRDRADVERLLVLHGPRLDLARVRSIVAQVAEVLEEPARVAEFEAIVRRVRATTGEGPR
jgi:hypothetical protein